MPQGPPPRESALPLPVIRAAEAPDLPAVMAALRALAEDLGDPFRATTERLHAALFGPGAFVVAHLAGERTDTVGAALSAPLFSTMGGGPILYVSDLWVHRDARGAGLGRRLLAAAARDGAARWGTTALKLTVYEENAGGLAFYRALGFVIHGRDRSAVLDAESVAGLTGGTG